MNTRFILVLGLALVGCGEESAPPEGSLDGLLQALGLAGLGSASAAPNGLGTAPGGANGLGVAPQETNDLGDRRQPDGLGRPPGASGEGGAPSVGATCSDVCARVEMCFDDVPRNCVRDCQRQVDALGLRAQPLLDCFIEATCSGVARCIEAVDDVENPAPSDTASPGVPDQPGRNPPAAGGS